MQEVLEVLGDVDGFPHCLEVEAAAAFSSLLCS